jgi:hypothetical protein
VIASHEQAINDPLLEACSHKNTLFTIVREKLSDIPWHVSCSHMTALQIPDTNDVSKGRTGKCSIEGKSVAGRSRVIKRPVALLIGKDHYRDTENKYSSYGPAIVSDGVLEQGHKTKMVGADSACKRSRKTANPFEPTRPDDKVSRYSSIGKRSNLLGVADLHRTLPSLDPKKRCGSPLPYPLSLPPLKKHRGAWLDKDPTAKARSIDVRMRESQTRRETVNVGSSGSSRDQDCAGQTCSNVDMNFFSVSTFVDTTFSNDMIDVAVTDAPT